MKEALPAHIELHRLVEIRLNAALAEWYNQHRRLTELVRVYETNLGLLRAVADDQKIWITFREAHTLRQTANVLRVLELRGLTISDFVGAWARLSDLSGAIHDIWRAGGKASLDSQTTWPRR